MHVVDGSSQQPELEFDAVRLELELFSPEIAEKPYVVAYNKMDLPEARENWLSFKKRLQAHGIEVLCMSAVNREGTHEVICAAYELLQKYKEAKREFEGQIFTFMLFSFQNIKYFYICSKKGQSIFRLGRSCKLESCS